MNTFAEVFRALRAASGMTLEALATKMKSHKGYASGIANAKVNPPSVAILRRVAKAFERTLEAAGIHATQQDWVEFAYLSKAPIVVRDRLLGLIQDNPLARMEITSAPPVERVPAKTVLKPAASLPSEKDAPTTKDMPFGQAPQDLGTAAPLGAER